MIKIYFGYEGEIGFGIIMFFIFVGFLINMSFNIYFLLKKIFDKTNKKNSSFDLILFILSISEALISLIWFISSLTYRDNISMFNDNNEIKMGCRIFGFFQSFLYFFDWLLSGCAIYHLRNMILNPINFILKPLNKLRKYIIICLLISIIVSIISYCLNSIGKSPMISCFLSINKETIFRNIIIYLFICSPIYILIFFFAQYCTVKTNPSYKNDPENKKIFDSYYKYSLFNLIIISLMPLLYLINWINNDSIEENPSWLFFILTLIISFEPLILGILRLNKAGLFKYCFKKNKVSSIEIENFNIPLMNTLDNEDEPNIEKFETSAIKKFVMNIYISVCFSLEKSISRKTSEKCEINQDNCNEMNEYKITKSDILSDPYILKLDKDSLLKSREDFNITCVEYAPKIFAYLRQLDSVEDEEILTSLLPMNNKTGIKDSEGRGGSFFLNSYDNEFSIKTITFHESELLRGTLLNQLAQYFNKNEESIIGRLYGMYKISNNSGVLGEDDLCFILMKNVIGSFNENLICKYDLKGSSLNREVMLGEYVENVMKDNNFKDIEQVLLLNKKNSSKLQNIVTEDANFFSRVKLMDYSLLVAKVSLNKDEIEDLFGKYHRRKTETEFFEIAGKEDESIDEIVEIENDNNIKENEQKNKNEEELEENKNKIIRYNKDKLAPLSKYFFPSLKGDVLYIIAIIDFFQEYNINKALETKFKLLKTGVKEKDISSVPPEMYKDRFIEFVKNITDVENYVKGLTNTEKKEEVK